MSAPAVLVPVLATVLLACGANPALTPTPSPPEPEPVTKTPAPKRVPAPDPEAQRRNAAREQLALLTMAPTRLDMDVIERLAGIGCVNLIHNCPGS